MVVTNKDRKYRDICSDFKSLTHTGLKIEVVCATLAWKYYMNSDTIYKIFQENNHKYFTNYQYKQQAQSLIEESGLSVVK